MKIYLPINWATVDLDNEQHPDKFGEALRNYCFRCTSEELGCYSSFELGSFFKQVFSGKEYEKIIKVLWKDSIAYVYNSGEITVAWAWDGDGVLYIRYKDRAVINYDCKCTYGWEWIKC